MVMEEVGTASGVKVQTVDISQNFPFLVGAGQISEGADWVFEEASAGDVSPVFETTQAFYMLELVSSEPEGVLPLEQARAAFESTLLFERKMAQARIDGQAAVARIRSGETMEDIAEDLGLEISDTGLFSRSSFVPGLGRQNSAIGAACTHKNQTANPPNIAPKLLPVPPTITITHITNVYLIGL